MTGYHRKYRNISRRKFLLTTTGVIAGITTAGLITASCSRKTRQSKPKLAEIDFIGPEELFQPYHSHFKKFKRTVLHFKTLDEALYTNSDGAVVFLPLAEKASVLLMLLEMEKDILTPYPLAKNYEEFDILQRQSNASDRRIAMLDPLRFWQPVQSLADYLQDKEDNLKRIELIINQDTAKEPFIPSADGFTGEAGRLIRLVSCILKRNFTGIITKSAEHLNILRANNLLDLEVVFEGISMHCMTDSAINGWSVIFSGDNLNLSLNNEGIIKGIKDANDKDINAQDTELKTAALTKNIGDFIKTIRSRKEPGVNSLDGMAVIELNVAALESAGNRDFQST